MEYKLKVSEAHINNKSFVNKDNRTECVELVRQTTGAPQTTKWVKGRNVMEAKIGEIAKGTAIATFNAQGKYQGHAAIYISHSPSGIVVYDQWVDKKTGNKPTSSRVIKSRSNNKNGRLQNIAENYSVVN